jgi:hypothetical protein
MKAAFLGGMHDNFHGFTLGSSGALDRFIMDNVGMVGVPLSTLLDVDLSSGSFF